LRKLLEEIQRRKDAKEDLCDDCDGIGGDGSYVCVSCLGQGILLTREEYDELLRIAHYHDDSILEQEFLE